MKRIIRTSFFIIGLGALLIVIGFMTGGRIKRAFYGYDEEWSMHDENTGAEIAAYTPDMQLMIPGGSALQHLKADVSYAVLRIEPHDEPFVSYNITGNTKKRAASVHIADNALLISTNKRRNRLFGWYGNTTERLSLSITVRIPRNTAFETVAMNIGVASLFLDGFTITKAFSLNTGVGEVEIKNIIASNVDIKTGMGETAFRNCTFTDTVLQTGLGETSFDGRILKNLDINAGVGAIDMRINGKKSDYTIHSITGIGSILINERTATGIRNSFRVSAQDAPHTMNIKAGIGEVRIHFTE